MTNPEPEAETTTRPDAVPPVAAVPVFHPATVSPADENDGPLVTGAAELRQRLQQVRASFVDDPHGSVAAAADLAEEATGLLIAALRACHQRIGDSLKESDSSSDTEAMRAAFLRYQSLFNQIPGMA
jgi:hypothetical protein